MISTFTKLPQPSSRASLAILTASFAFLAPLLAQQIKIRCASDYGGQNTAVSLQERLDLGLPCVADGKILVPVVAIGAEHQKAVTFCVFIGIGAGVGAAGTVPKALYLSVFRQSQLESERNISSVLENVGIFRKELLLGDGAPVSKGGDAGVDAGFLQDPGGGDIDNEGLFKGLPG